MHSVFFHVASRCIFSVRFTLLQVSLETQLVEERRHVPMAYSEDTSTKQVPLYFSAKPMSYRATFPKRPRNPMYILTCTSTLRPCRRHEHCASLRDDGRASQTSNSLQGKRTLVISRMVTVLNTYPSLMAFESSTNTTSHLETLTTAITMFITYGMISNHNKNISLL